MTERRLLAAVLAGLFVSTFAGFASANAGGLAGYTGKPYAAYPNGQSCNQCHSGGTAPTVTLMGPASLNAGQSADYDLVVTTGQSRAAGSIAATDGVVIAPVSTSLRDSFGELVPNGNSVPASGTATFRFKVTAPATGSAIKLWAVGLACNGSGNSGDRASHTTKDVTIVGGAPPAPTGTGTSTPPPPPPGGTPTADAGSGGNSAAPGSGTGAGSGTGTGTGTGTGSSGSSSPAADGDDDDGSSPNGSRPNGASTAAACSAGGVIGEVVPGGILSALGFVAAVVIGARRKRR